MEPESLKLLVQSALKSFVHQHSPCMPISSLDLLAQIVATTNTTLRLTDLSLFERVLEDLSKTWAEGRIALARTASSMTIWDISIHTRSLSLVGAGLIPQHTNGSGGGDSAGRKRKRVIDEDADSAEEEEYLEGDEDDSQTLSAGGNGTGRGGTTSLQGLSDELKEVYVILQRSTARGRLLAEQFASKEGETFEPICSHITRDECAKHHQRVGTGSHQANSAICDRVHFRPLIRPHTDPTLGHCSYLNTCYSEPTYSQSPAFASNNTNAPTTAGLAPPNTRGATSLPSGLGAGGRGKEKAPCRYLHFEVDWDGPPVPAPGEIVHRGQSNQGALLKKTHRLGIGLGAMGKQGKILPAQWINCDVRRFDYSVLGKFHCIMADPPWDIHMTLPYGTMKDDEMLDMPIPQLQDEGFLFLWVTGRAMELGRECLKRWGYTRVDEVIWVKTNQLQRVIRTGRTGHWLNHTKEHMLVGVKTKLASGEAGEEGELQFPSWANRGLDTDVIVSEVRETSRKPDEVYGMIDRVCPGGRKIEIFGRMHNTRPGWLTLGNQLSKSFVAEEDMAERIRTRYPEMPLDTPTTLQTPQ